LIGGLRQRGLKTKKTLVKEEEKVEKFQDLTTLITFKFI
jgi:hypothetical protein